MLAEPSQCYQTAPPPTRCSMRGLVEVDGLFVNAVDAVAQVVPKSSFGKMPYANVVAPHGPHPPLQHRQGTFEANIRPAVTNTIISFPTEHPMLVQKRHRHVSPLSLHVCQTMFGNFIRLHQDKSWRNCRAQRRSNVDEPVPQCFADCRAPVPGTATAAAQQSRIWPSPLGHRSRCAVAHLGTNNASHFVPTLLVDLLRQFLASGKPDLVSLGWLASSWVTPNSLQVVRILLCAAVSRMPSQKIPPHGDPVLQLCAFAVCSWPSSRLRRGVSCGAQ